MNQRFCRWIICVLILSIDLLMPSLFAAQPTVNLKKLSLKEAILLSLRTNPNVESAELQRVIDKFNVAVARNQFEFQYAMFGNANSSESVSSGVPSGLSRNITVTPGIQKQTVYGTQYNLSMTNPWSWSSNLPQYLYAPALTLNVTHPILQGSGREIVEAPLHIALYNNEIAKLNLKSTIINQVTLIINDYLALVGAENQLIVDQNGLAAAKKTVMQNKKQIEIGFMAPSENDQAKASVASTAIQVASDINAVQQAKLVLLRDIGLDPSTPIEVNKNIHLMGMNYPKGQEAQRILLANNITYLQTLLQLKISKINVLLAEDTQRWSLNLVGTIVQGAGSGIGPNGGIGSLFNGLNRGRSVGLDLTIPIDNLPQQATVVNATVGYTQAKLAARFLKLTLETQLASALQNIDILFKQLTLTKQSTALARKSYENALKKVAFGQSTMFEVTTLQTNYLTAQIQSISAQINYLSNIANFQQTLGITLDVWEVHLVY